jgi:branched-chain amino acid transport system ATP-binding protein
MKFGGLTAIGEVSLEVKEREIFGLIGPNGAGKTTVFNMIPGHYRPTEGRVLFKEKEITGLPPDRITRNGIARTFQNIRLFRISQFSRMLWCLSIILLPAMERL